MTFKRGDRVRYSEAFLERGRKIDSRWYAEHKGHLGTVEHIERDGDVVVRWDGRTRDHGMTVQPPHRLEHASATANPKTYREAKAELWTYLERAGWAMSDPRLKVPHATSPGGGARIWFKPQALWYSTHAHSRPEGSLWMDVRSESLEDVARYAESLAYRNNPLSSAVMFVSITAPDGTTLGIIRCSSEEECGEVIRDEAGRLMPMTIFSVVGEDERGRPVPIDRWAVDFDGRLVNSPYRGRRASQYAPTEEDDPKTRYVATRRSAT